MCSAMLANRKIAKGTEPNFVNAKMAKHSAARKGTEKSVNRSALPICGAVCARETRASFQAEKLTVSSPATATLQTESHSERNAITSRSAGDFKYATVATVATLKTMAGIREWLWVKT